MTRPESQSVETPTIVKPICFEQNYQYAAEGNKVDYNDSETKK